MSIEERLAQLSMTEARRYDSMAKQMSDRGMAHLSRVCDFDLYAAMILSRDTLQRRAFVANIQKFHRQKYKFFYENEADDEFRQRMDRLFALADGTTPLANLFQMYIIHVAVLIDPEIGRSLCPPPPDQDDPHAVDKSLVNRYTFRLWEERYLLPLFGDMIAGTHEDVFTFVWNLDAAYIALLPPSPVDAVIASRHRRNVVFRDPTAAAIVKERTTTFMPS